MRGCWSRRGGREEREKETQTFHSITCIALSVLSPSVPGSAVFGSFMSPLHANRAFCMLASAACESRCLFDRGGRSYEDDFACFGELPTRDCLLLDSGKARRECYRPAERQTAAGAPRRLARMLGPSCAFTASIRPALSTSLPNVVCRVSHSSSHQQSSTSWPSAVLLRTCSTRVRLSLPQQHSASRELGCVLASVSPLNAKAPKSLSPSSRLSSSRPSPSALDFIVIARQRIARGQRLPRPYLALKGARSDSQPFRRGRVALDVAATRDRISNA